MNPTLNWNSDRRLDVLVLGPMNEDEAVADSCLPVQKAVQQLLQEPAFEDLLSRNSIAKEDRRVHVPEKIGGQDIIQSVLARLDVADLVIFNLTPKKDKEEASANVFYELGLVHALGIPAIFIIQGDAGKVPFYAREIRLNRVANFETETLTNALRSVLFDFLSGHDPENNYLNDRVSQFYGLPIVDISAAVGLATGYYYNFISRLITEGRFLGLYPQLIRQVLIVRPTSVSSTYQADLEALKKSLQTQGHSLTTEKLSAPDGDTLGPLWFDHVQGIVIDIPRTVYPLQRSPRILAFHQHHQNFKSATAERVYTQRLSQFGDQLVDRFMDGLRYQVRVDGTQVRSKILHYTDIEKAPQLVSKLLS